MSSTHDRSGRSPARAVRGARRGPAAATAETDDREPPYGWESALTLAQLRAVVAVARLRSFTAAAAELGTTQPAVTRAVAGAEAALGLALFDRSTRAVAVRAGAEEFVERVERVLAELRAAGGAVRGEEPAGARRVRVACLMSVACTHLPEAIRRLRTAHPGARVVCAEAMQAQVEADVASGRADLGVADVNRVGASLSAHPLWTEAYHVCVPASHRFAGRRAVALGELAGEDLVAFPRQARLRVDLDQALARARAGLRAPVVEVQQYETAFRMVAAGLGITVVPACMVPLAPVGLALPRVRDAGVGRTIGVVWRADSPPPPLARAVASTLAAVAADPTWTLADRPVASGGDDPADPLPAASPAAAGRRARAPRPARRGVR